MHALDTIIWKNRDAAIRELSHEIIAGKLTARGEAIMKAITADMQEENEILARARQEG